MRTIIISLVLLAGVTGCVVWYLHANAKPDVEFKTAKVERGDLLSSISATGTVEPQDVVDVGAQVAGLIQTFGVDADKKPIDYRSPVEPGMVLATIDPAVYQADFDTAKAQLAQAHANVQKAQADLAQANAKLIQAQANWTRAEKIGPSDALSQNDYDMYRADYETARANVAVADAGVAQATTGIAQAQAELDKAKRNLDFCTIKSPVKGVIIARRVNVGQTVVSSLNAPSLFLIGKDLTQMQVWVAVNEADIGKIFPGQNVTFTCDAFPGRTFKGSVNKVRLNAQMTQNVVTYTVEVNTDNSDGKLLPYLTANLQFEVQRDANVLLVPNAALRWYPSEETEVSPDARAEFKPVERGTGWGDNAKPPERKDADADGKKGAGGVKKKRERTGTIWIKDGPTFVRPVKVKIGATDGLNTTVTADDLKEGQEVVLGEIVQTEKSGAVHNPFIPQMGGGKKRG